MRTPAFTNAIGTGRVRVTVHRQRTAHGLGTMRQNRPDNASTHTIYMGEAFVLAGFLVSLGWRNLVKKG